MSQIVLCIAQRGTLQKPMFRILTLKNALSKLMQSITNVIYDTVHEFPWSKYVFEIWEYFHFNK